MSPDFNTARAKYFRHYIAWLKGERDDHPAGKSGLRWVVDPYEGSKNMRFADYGQE
jgi:hypothetical protein